MRTIDPSPAQLSSLPISLKPLLMRLYDELHKLHLDREAENVAEILKCFYDGYEPPSTGTQSSRKRGVAIESSSKAARRFPIVSDSQLQSNAPTVTSASHPIVRCREPEGVGRCTDMGAIVRPG